MKVTDSWKRIPRGARIGAAVAVSLLGVVLAGALVATMTGVLTIGNVARNTPAPDQDATGSFSPAPQPRNRALSQLPSGPPTPSLSPPDQTSRNQAPPEQPGSLKQVPEDVAETDTNAGTFLEARLEGRNAVPAARGPAGGDPNGSAVAWVRINGDELCYALTWTRIGPVTNARIHAGEAGRNGTVQAGFFDALPATLRGAGGCLNDGSGKLARIAANPAGHYVNLASREAPGGAVRGQLRKLPGPVDLLAPFRGQVGAALRGDQIVQAAGDPDGAGAGFVQIDGKEVRFGVTWTGLTPPTDAQLHTGPAGPAGSVAVRLFSVPGGLPGGLFAVSGAVRAERRVAAQIDRDPSSFSVNVLTSQFPGGAIGGQLLRL